MFQLIYPAQRVASVLDGAKTSKASEMLPVIDLQGEVTGQASRQVCHGGSHLLHPVVHLHVVNRKGEIYLQQRSQYKKNYPLFWDSAVGGHVSYGEQLEEALFREAAEEIGLFDFNPVALGTFVWDSQREKEMVCVYATVGNFEIKPDNYEVQQGKYWTTKEIENAFGKGILTPDLEQEYILFKDKIMSLL